MKTSPKWSFKGRTDPQGTKQRAPGPGAYNSVEPDAAKWSKSQRVVFGTSNRTGMAMQDGKPGPGQYNPGGGIRTAPKYGFGTSQRAAVGMHSITPGPGAYDRATTLGADGAKYSVTARRVETAKNSNTPGPGTYKTGTDALSQIEKPPNWTFGTSGRSPRATAKNYPGPGAYEYSSTVGKESPAYTMRSRRHYNDKNSQQGNGGSTGGMYTQFGY